MREELAVTSDHQIIIIVTIILERHPLVPIFLFILLQEHLHPSSMLHLASLGHGSLDLLVPERKPIATDTCSHILALASIRLFKWVLDDI